MGFVRSIHRRIDASCPAGEATAILRRHLDGPDWRIDSEISLSHVVHAQRRGIGRDARIDGVVTYVTERSCAIDLYLKRRNDQMMFEGSYSASIDSLAEAVRNDIARLTNRGQSAAPLMKKCPRCAEEVKAEAAMCRFCRWEFGPQPGAITPD